MLRKYASLQVLESWRAPAHGSTERLRKRAHRVGFDYAPRPGYLYVRSRMISSRCNDNHDEFPALEIEAGYKTFLGKPVFVNHNNSNHRRARGVVVAVALHRDRNPDGSPDTWVEGLMEIDAVRFPKLAKAILAGRVNRTSMGVDVERSTCSACGNVATSPAEYCRHLPSMKGKKHRKRVEGKVREEIIREVCAGLSFFENSLLVEDPADPTAYVLGKPDDRGLKMSASQGATLTQRVEALPGGRQALANARMRRAASMRPVEMGPEDLRAQAASRPAYPDPADHPFYQANPVSKDNVLRSWNESTDNEKALGGRWYSDAHHIAKAIAGGNAALGAGVLSAYSPQTSWPANLMNASNALRNPDNPPGPGSGAMTMHKKAASRILAGESNDAVLQAPKTNAFARLITYGDDSPENKAAGKTDVVMDRHAMSVAIGRRTTKDDDLGFLGNPHYYEHAAETYRQAAAELSAVTGQKVAPHVVQAVTWLRQQRANNEADAETAAGKGRMSRTINDWRRWQEHQTEHHPEMPETMHGGNPHEGSLGTVVSKLAYGETKVPQQVDTLRAENCPVCGEQDVWSGDRCPVCGFVAPPDMFRDPDVDKAADVREELEGEGEVALPPDPDANQAGLPPQGEQQGSFPDADNQMLHPDQLTPNGVPAVEGEDGSPIDPNAEMEQGGQDEEQGEEEAEQGEEEQEAAAESMLQCPACGEQVDPGETGAAAGDPCPVCGNAPLEPVADEEPAQKGQEPPQPGGSTKMGAKQAAQDATLMRQAALERENAILRAQLRFVAELAGVGPELEQIRRQADVMNPGSPVPDPPEAPPSQTTEDALASGGARPAGQNGAAPRPPAYTVDDPSRPGATPGSMENVPAAQTTTAITPGVEIQTPPATQLQDVTAPVQGTNPSQDGGVPVEQRRIETDVRIDPNPLKAEGPGVGGLGSDGTAYPWVMDARDGGQQQKAASAADQAGQRTFASIRLAKLRVQAGLDRGDELAVAQRIEGDGNLTVAMIEREVETLGALASRPAPQARPMQRQASRPAPSLAAPAQPLMAYASAASSTNDDSDLFLD